MFKLDIFNNPQPLKVYLVNVNGDILGCINDIIDESSASLHIIFTQQYELNFDVVEKQDNKGWYEFLHEGMYLYVDSVGLFKLNQPTITYDGITEKKSVVAYSVDSELEDKTTDISINMGTKESLEYLVEYEPNETEELINPYTGVPYDWIVLYNAFPEQLNDLEIKYDDGYFGTPEIVSINGESTTQIVVTDPDKIDELSKIFELIPRLLNKITYVNNQDGSKDSVLTEYVIIEYDPTDAEVVVSYTLTSGFRDRIVELIIFYLKYRDQLSLLSLVLENTGWKIGTIFGMSQGDYSLCNKKFQFEINENIYSFFTQSFSKVSESIVTFDMIERKVNITPIEQFGDDTGIVMGYDTLVNSLNISTEDEKLTTRLYVSGGDDLDITRVNFGSNYIDNLIYIMNVTDSNGKRIYVSNNLYIRYMLFYSMRNNMRKTYIEKSMQYEQNLQKIDELKYRLPNDGLKTDWGTYTLEELKASLTAYKNLLVTLTSLYKEDYGTAGLNNDGSINENYIKNTEYWWDYEAYKNIIIEIECAIDVFPYYNDSSKWTASQKTQYESQTKAWETEWSLYGIIELEAKISTYEQNMKLMLDGQESKSAVIKKNDGSDWGIKTWAELNDDEKSMYGYSELLYRYDIYMQYYNNMVSAKTYLATLKAQLETLEAEQETLQSDLNTITNQVQFSSYFTEKECESLYHLLRDSDYSNENIFVTSIDTVSDKYERMSELLDDAKEQLSIYARPQLNFSIESENLLALPEFKPMWSQFIPGNYIYVQYKDSEYVKLRLIGYTFNPCLPSSKDLQLEFSNFLLSTSTYNDWASLLGKGSSGSRRSSGGSSGSSGSYGDMDDIDVTISNTLLTKLLKSETFGTRVTDIILDTIDANKLTARLATFGGLANGTTTIDGNCIQTGYIIDNAYRHEVDIGNVDAGDIDNEAGTIINLENGQFNFGGGKLTYDGTNLTVDGTINATAGEIGDFKLVNGALYTGQKDADNTNVAGVRISPNEINLSNGTADTTIKLGKGTLDVGGKLTYNGIHLSVDGIINAEMGGNIGGFSIGDNIANNIYLLRVIYPPHTQYVGNIVKQYAIQAPDYYGLKGQIEGGSPAYYTGARTANFLYSRGTTSWSGDDSTTTWDYYFRVTEDGDIYGESASIRSALSANSATIDGNLLLNCAHEYNTNNATISIQFRRTSNASFSAPIIRSDKDGVAYLGSNNYKWNTVYSQNGVVTGSDRKNKEHIEYLIENDEIENFVYGLKPVMYYLKNGTGHRHHMGLYAQDVIEQAHRTIGDISACDAVVVGEDENGNPIEEYYNSNVDDTHLNWSLNYNELIAPIISVIQKQKEKIDELESRLATLES